MEVNNEQCILVGNHFANVMQFVVSVVAVSVLFLHKIFVEDNAFQLRSHIMVCFSKKRYTSKKQINEYLTHKRRHWPVWFMDNTKQGLSSAIAHIYATYIAVQFSANEHADDPCAWFFIQFLLDTLFGVFISFGISKGSIMLIGLWKPAIVRRWFIIGHYTTITPAKKYYVWAVQVLHWLTCSILARVICSLFMYITIGFWANVALGFSSVWTHHRHAELVFVVLGMPILMNSIQFLLTNWYLHWTRPAINNADLLQRINVEAEPSK